MIRRGRADGGVVDDTAFPSADDEPRPFTDHPKVKEIMDIARAAAFAQPKASQSEEERRSRGRLMSIGIRG